MTVIDVMDKIRTVDYITQLNRGGTMTISPSLHQREQDKFKETAAGDTAVRTLNQMGLIKEEYDYIALTYVNTTGDTWEVETATYKIGGAAGTTVGVLTLAYDGFANLSSVTKS